VTLKMGQRTLKDIAFLSLEFHAPLPTQPPNAQLTHTATLLHQVANSTVLMLTPAQLTEVVSIALSITSAETLALQTHLAAGQVTQTQLSAEHKPPKLKELPMMASVTRLYAHLMLNAQQRNLAQKRPVFVRLKHAQKLMLNKIADQDISVSTHFAKLVAQQKQVQTNVYHLNPATVQLVLVKRRFVHLHQIAQALGTVMMKQVRVLFVKLEDVKMASTVTFSRVLVFQMPARLTLQFAFPTQNVSLDSVRLLVAPKMEQMIAL
jgi:hypothetical protein